MKNGYILALLIVIGVGMPSTTFAQAKLGLYTTSVSNSTPNLNDQISIFTKLKNTSTTDTFSGVINFLLANKDSIITNLSVVGKPPFTGTSITLAPLEEKAALFTVQLLPTYFKAGPDIIIVWPVASVAVVDSARAPIQIANALGLEEQGGNEIQLFVANEQLFVRKSGQENALQYVRIYAVSGALIEQHSLHAMNNTIPLQQLPSGMYIVEMVSGNSIMKRIKFLK
jgi:hypothetical protein